MTSAYAGAGSGPVTVAELAGALIAVFEGCKLSAYLDSGGVWTIGYGHTGTDVQHNSKITQAQAEQFLQQDQAPLFKMVADVKSVPHAAALVSFGYNCGVGALSKVLQGHAFPSEFVHDQMGNELPGLVARRRLEELLMML